MLQFVRKSLLIGAALILCCGSAAGEASGKEQAIAKARELIQTDSREKWTEALELLSPYAEDGDCRELYTRIRVGTYDFIAPFVRDAAPFMVRDGSIESWGLLAADGTVLAEPVYADINGWAQVIGNTAGFAYNRQEPDQAALFQMVNAAFRDNDKTEDADSGLLRMKRTPSLWNDGDFAATGKISSSFLSHADWGFLNTRGEEVVPPQYTAVSDFYMGKALVVNADREALLINTEGEVTDTLPASEDYAYSRYLGYGLAEAGTGFQAQARGAAGEGFRGMPAQSDHILDLEGRPVLTGIAGTTRCRGERLIITKTDENGLAVYGLTDLGGKEILPCEYAWMGFVTDGIVLCRTGEKAYALYGTDGSPLTGPEAGSAAEFEILGRGFLAGVREDGTLFVTDAEGTVYRQGDQAPDFRGGHSRLSAGLCFAASEDGETYALYRIEGDRILRKTEGAYPLILVGNTSGYFPAQTGGGVWDILDPEGESAVR